MIRYLLLFTTLICAELSFAQYAYFGTRGKIQFEKTTYIQARMKRMMGDMPMTTNRQGRFIMGADIGGGIPESMTQKVDLYFDENQTLLVPLEDDQNTSSNTQGRRIGARQGQGGTMQTRQGQSRPNMRNVKAQKILFQDLKKSTSEIQMTIDEKYILSDSLSEITWRFTDEYRTIAGQECRRVNGATKDSLYIIAYYSDQIPVSAGPALVHGLPGMVLGLVIPEMHIHYWATKVEYSAEPIPNDWRDKKSKSMTLDQFSTSFGRYFQRGEGNDSYRRRVLEEMIY